MKMQMIHRAWGKKNNYWSVKRL